MLTDGLGLFCISACGANRQVTFPLLHLQGESVHSSGADAAAKLGHVSRLHVLTALPVSLPLHSLSSGLVLQY